VPGTRAVLKKKTPEMEKERRSNPEIVGERGGTPHRLADTLALRNARPTKKKPGQPAKGVESAWHWKGKGSMKRRNNITDDSETRLGHPKWKSVRKNVDLGRPAFSGRRFGSKEKGENYAAQQ